MPSADGAGEGCGRQTSRQRYFADVCYAGQAYHLEVTFEPGAADPLAALAAAFYAAHDRTYGYAPKAPLRLVNLRTVHSVAGARHLQDEWAPADRPALLRSARILLPEQQAGRRGRGLRSRRIEGGRHASRPRHHRAGRHHHAAHSWLALPGRRAGQSVARTARKLRGRAREPS